MSGERKTATITDLDLPVAQRNKENYKAGGISLPVSAYNPSKEIKDRTRTVMERFQRAAETHEKPYREFNDTSLTVRMDTDQKLFNNWREAKSDDPDEEWHSRAVRPIVRNRTISIAAHLSGQLLTPAFRAQNDRQQEDKEASTVIRYLVEWANDQAEYVRTFLYAVIAALVNPASIIHTEYAEHYRTIKDIQEDGSWKEKEVLDEELSGFQDQLVPLDEFFIADVYEHNIQRQPFLLWRRALPYHMVALQYREHSNWKFVKPGIQNIFDATENSFYEMHDESLGDTLVEKVVYYDRYNDLQLCFVNGVLVTDVAQPNPRKDKQYPFVKGGYELIDEGKFFYYFSLVRKMADDADIINTLYRMVIDGSFLKTMPPVGVMGDVEISSSIMVPRKITTIGENMKIEPLGVGSDLGAGMSVLEKLESSVSESSNDVQQAGLTNPNDKTAFQVSVEERNAQILGGMVRRMVGFMVRDWMKLRVSDILQFMTVGEIDEIVGDDATLKYRSFLMPKRTIGGKSVSPRLLMTTQNQYSPEQVMAMEGGAEEGQLENMPKETLDEFLNKGFKSEERIYMINPITFRDLKYKVIVTTEIERPVSEALERVLNLEEYDRAVANPFGDQEALYRDLLLGSYSKTKDDVDKYVKREIAPPLPVTGQSGGSVINKVLGRGAEQQLNANVGTAPLGRGVLRK